MNLARAKVEALDNISVYSLLNKIYNRVMLKAMLDGTICNADFLRNIA